ncbi:MAG: DUF423 domain-containing protein [Rhodospirillales bacterium]
MRLWLFLGALNGFLAVIAGAYGWHALATDSGTRAMFAVAVQYHMWHALALIATAWAADRFGPDSGAAAYARYAGWAFLIGIIFFCGSIYTIALLGYPPVAGTAPAGGFAFIAGWVLLILTAVKARKP